MDVVRAYQIFQILRYASFFITGMAMAKSGIALTEIGIYETLMFVSGAVSFFWVSGLLTKLLASYAQYKNNESVLFQYFVLLFAISSLVCVFLKTIEPSVLEALNISSGKNYFNLFICFMLFNNITFLNEHILLLKKRQTEILIYGFALFVGSVSAVAISVFVFGSLKMAFWLLLIVAVAKTVYLLCLIYRYDGFKINITLLSGIIITSLPLIGSLLASGSADYIDTFLVSHFAGPEQLAVFRFGAKELPLALLLANGLSTAMIVQLSADKLSAQSLEIFKIRVTKLMHIIFPVSIALMLISPFVYPILFSVQFSASAAVFCIYLLLVISRVVFPQTLLIAAGYNKIIFKVSLIEIIVNITASFLLMQHLGIIGVAWGTIIAFFTEKIILCYYLKAKCNLKITQILSLKTYLFYCLALVAAYCFSVIILI